MTGEHAPAVRAERIQKTYGRGAGARAAVCDVSLTVERGELLAILGPSGCGKSTLLGILGGLDREHEGEVELFGRPLSSLSDAELSRVRGRSVGFVFQAFHLLPHLSVLDNVLAPALFDASGEDRSAHARATLARLGLGDRAGDTPAELSGGQRQRVAIARALLMRPKILFCDEPTGNLDRETGAETIALFRELHERDGLTIVAVTHEERLARAASRVVCLSDGKIVEPSGAADTEGELRA
jgi:putative ABC transport system ATP-binding protein